jgi:hypothetical protein
MAERPHQRVKSSLLLVNSHGCVSDLTPEVSDNTAWWPRKGWHVPREFVIFSDSELRRSSLKLDVEENEHAKNHSDD